MKNCTFADYCFVELKRVRNKAGTTQQRQTSDKVLMEQFLALNSFDNLQGNFIVMGYSATEL
jgi:hypothetical protein